MGEVAVEAEDLGLARVEEIPERPKLLLEGAGEERNFAHQLKLTFGSRGLRWTAPIFGGALSEPH